MIKSFDKFFGKRYKKGDYILLKDKEDDRSIELECLILAVHNGKNLNYNFWYDIEVFDDHDELIVIDIFPDEVERKMTPEEIKKYNIRKNAKKYNL